MLHFLWLFPFKLITLWKEWLYRKVDRTFVGTSLSIFSGGSWKKATALPSFRYEFGATTVNDKIYVIGGITAPTVYTVTKRNEVYDVQTKKWQKVADCPVIIHHPGVTTDGNKIYVIGGNGLRITSYSYAHSYNPQTNTWQRLADMPTKRCALGLAYQDGKIYAVGGADNKKPLSSFEEYDIETNTWQRLANMPTNREHLFAVGTIGQIFAIGGYQNDRFHNIDTFESYDIKERTWSELPPIPAKISGFSACVHDGSIFVFGGEQGWSLSGEVYQYQIAKKEWRRRTNMPEARYACTATVASDGLHIIGGNTRMLSHQFSNAHDIFVP